MRHISTSANIQHKAHIYLLAIVLRYCHGQTKPLNHVYGTLIRRRMLLHACFGKTSQWWYWTERDKVKSTTKLLHHIKQSLDVHVSWSLSI